MHQGTVMTDQSIFWPYIHVSLMSHPLRLAPGLQIARHANAHIPDLGSLTAVFIIEIINAYPRSLLTNSVHSL